MYRQSYTRPTPYHRDYGHPSPPASPSPYGHSPRYSTHTATPSPRSNPKGHSRRASQEASYSYAYTSSKDPGNHRKASYAPSGYTTQERKPDYARGFDRGASKTRRSGVPFYQSARPSKGTKYRGHEKCYHDHFNDFVSSEESLPRYAYEQTPPPPYSQESRYRNSRQQHYVQRDHVPIYTRAEETTVPLTKPKKSTHIPKAQPPPPKARPTTAYVPRVATAADAYRHRIPAGFNLDKWDPTEEPIILIGSVFDANSLGKWIYDWTVAYYGAATPMSEVAGDLWLLLIQLSGKLKRADECLPRIRRADDYDLITDFTESGDRLWDRFEALLKVCEEYMWKAARKDTGSKKPRQMGPNSGYDFVRGLLGRDRQLEKTEKLMAAMRLWSMRFDVNCEDILRYPA